MNATYLFFGLVGLFVVLFGIALIKPYFAKKPVGIDEFKRELGKLLPNHDLLAKQGTPSRIIISLNGIQKAIVVMDKPKDDYIMGGLPIFTVNKLAQLKAVVDKINQLNIVKN